jgi:AraC-like DNA-binding protein
MTELPAFLSLFEIEPLMRVSGNTYRHLYLDEAALNEVTKLIELLEGVWQYDHASKLIVEGYMIVILTIFCREYDKLQTRVGKNASNDKFFMDTISYIIKNINKNLTIDQLAHLSGLSRTAFIKRFRDTTGKSPKQFIMERRIQSAKKLLTTDRSISKVADECGFYDAAHFIKTFTRATGMSPIQYKNIQNGASS